MIDNNSVFAVYRNKKIIGFCKTEMGAQRYIFNSDRSLKVGSYFYYDYNNVVYETYIALSKKNPKFSVFLDSKTCNKKNNNKFARYIYLTFFVILFYFVLFLFLSHKA